MAAWLFRSSFSGTKSVDSVIMAATKKPGQKAGLELLLPSVLKRAIFLCGRFFNFMPV